MYPDSSLRTDIMRGLALVVLVASLVSCNLVNPFSSSSTSTPALGSVTITASNVSKLVKAWNDTLGGSVQFSTAPTVADGMIYIGAVDHNIGSETGMLDALDAKTGSELWSYSVGMSNSLSAPTVANGVVYIASVDDSGNDTLNALNAKTGTRLWNYSVGKAVYAIGIGAPIAANGVVYIVSVDDSGNDTLNALNAKTGTRLWSYSAGATGGFYTAPAVVANGVVYIVEVYSVSVEIGVTATGDGTLYALDAKTGTRLWSYTAGATGNFTAPTVSSGMVYITSENNYPSLGNDTLYALDAKTGTRLWSYTAGATSKFAAPTVSSGMVYITSESTYLGSGNGTLYALDAKTGTRLWSYTAGATGNFTAPTVSSGMVYITSKDNTNGSETDTLYALDATSGTKVWSNDMGSGFDSVLSVANGVVYIDSLYYGKLSALDAKSGTRLWIYFTGGSLEFPPTVTNTIVYVSSRKTLYAFAIPTRAPSPTATASSSNGITTVPRLVPTINKAPVFADVPGLHIQSTEGMQCPLSGSSGQSDDLVFTTGRLTYSKDEIRQIRNYLHEMVYGSESLENSYTLTPPPTLHWVSGSTYCSLHLEISNTGNNSVQIKSLGVQLLSAPQPNSSQSLHTIDACSVADQQDAGGFGCGRGGPSSGGSCSVYWLNIALKAAPAASIFAAAPEEYHCPEPTLHPNDTIVFEMDLSSPGPKQSTVAPYIYSVVPVLTVTDANGSHTFTLSSMAGIATFVDQQQITCYGLLHDQDTTFVPVSTFSSDRLISCLD